MLRKRDDGLACSAIYLKKSERNPCCNLYVARTAAAKKRITDADIGRDGDRKKADSTSRKWINTVEAGICGKAR